MSFVERLFLLCPLLRGSMYVSTCNICRNSIVLSIIMIELQELAVVDFC